MSNIVMFDSTEVDDLPVHPGAAYAGYVGGSYDNYSAVKRRFPDARVLSIAVASRYPAECLDIERGDATPKVTPGWIRVAISRGVWMPILYASRDLMPQILSICESEGIERSQVRLWTAHYSFRHVCNPETCGASFYADGTQWANEKITGKHYDESLLNEDFFQTEPIIPVEDDNMVCLIYCTNSTIYPKVLGTGLAADPIYLTNPTDLTQLTQAGAKTVRLQPDTYKQLLAKVNI